MIIRKKHLENIGESFHTALRKCCDSTPTSIAYNAVCLIDNDTNSIWLDYLNYLKKELVGKKVVIHKELARMVRNLSGESNEMHWHKTSEGNILYLAFRLFDIGDWMGMTTYLWYEINTKKEIKRSK